MDYFYLSMIIGILIIVGAITIVLLLIFRKRGRFIAETDYRAIFRLGLALTPSGVIILIIYVVYLGLQSIPIGFPILALGIIYLLVGLLNKDKWKK